MIESLIALRMAGIADDASARADVVALDIKTFAAHAAGEHDRFCHGNIRHRNTAESG